MKNTFRHLASAASLLLMFSVTAHADETLMDSFEEEFAFEWDIVRPTPEAYSLDANPGELTLTTQYGSIHGRTSEGDFARNLMLVDREIPAGQNFEATLAVSQFEPELHYQQVATLVYQGDDDYLKWSMERSWQSSGVDNLVLVRETSAEPQHDFVTQKTLDGPFWLRVARTGSNYTVAFSNDGEQFETIGTEGWTPSQADAPVKVGFLAKNGGNSQASDIDVLIESFTLRLLD